MRLTLAAILLIASLAEAQAESPAQKPGDTLKAHFAGLNIELHSDRPDIRKVSISRNGLSATVCEHGGERRKKMGCDAIDDLTEDGVRLFIFEPRDETNFNLIGEKPSQEGPPPPNPLTVIAEGRAARILVKGTEAYQLSRIQMGRLQLVTTDRGWPIASCQNGLSDRMNCTAGFLIKGAFVEAHWFVPDKVLPISQVEIWNLAAALDEKIRALTAAE